MTPENDKFSIPKPKKFDVSKVCLNCGAKFNHTNKFCSGNSCKEYKQKNKEDV